MRVTHSRFGGDARWFILVVTLLIPEARLLADEGSGDYPFGPIFTGQKERIQLDRYRIENAQSGDLVQIPTSLISEVPSQDGQTERVRFSGYITRSNGSQIIWVDGVTSLGTPAKDIRVSQGLTSEGQGSVEFETARGTAALKPGQVWLLNESRVVENYEAPGDPVQDVSVAGEAATPDPETPESGSLKTTNDNPL